MSALGQKQTSRRIRAMSLYPQKQTLLLTSGMFALLPISDIAPNRSSKQREATYWPFGIAVRLAQEQIYAYREYGSVGAG